MKLLKKSVTMLCIIALVCSLAATCFAADIGDIYSPMQLFAASTDYLTLANVRVRSGPGTNYAIVTDLVKGTTVTGDGASGDWIHITYDENVSGYIRRDLLCVKTRCYVTTAENGLNMRSTASTSGTILGTIPYNTFVEVTGRSSDGAWAYVLVREGTLEDRGGWVSTTYLQKYNGII